MVNIVLFLLRASNKRTQLCVCIVVRLIKTRADRVGSKSPALRTLHSQIPPLFFLASSLCFLLFIVADVARSLSLYFYFLKIATIASYNYLLDMIFIYF